MKYLLSLFTAFAIYSCTSQKHTTPTSGDTTVIATSTSGSVAENDTRTSSSPTKNIILDNPAEEEKENNVTVTSNNTTKPNVSTSSSGRKGSSNNLQPDHKLPSCLNSLVAQFKKEDVQNPPRKIYSYTYKNKTVYYVTPPCCDFFSDLYDSNCRLIAHPDGGITGRGDGREPDFIKLRADEKLVWEDSRKYR